MPRTIGDGCGTYNEARRDSVSGEFISHRSKGNRKTPNAPRINLRWVLAQRILNRIHFDYLIRFPISSRQLTMTRTIKNGLVIP